jgi:hypothetical protein
MDLKKALDLLDSDPKLRDIDVVNLSVFGNISVWCNDPSFTYYGWKYIASNLGYGLEPETRRPSKRNPRLQGTVCKHLYRVLTTLPMIMPQIVRDLKNRGFISKDYQRRKKEEKTPNQKSGEEQKVDKL